MKIRKRFLLVALAGPASLSALIGIPQIVIDPVQSAHAIQELAYQATSIGLSSATLTTAIGMLKQMGINATWTASKGGWQGVPTGLPPTQVNTNFGETSAWTPAVNLGTGVGPAWQTATYAMQPSPLYAGYGLGQSSMSANIATVNIVDGVSQSAMLTVADSRVNQQMNDAAIADLEASALDTSPTGNTEVAQLNVIANGLVLQNRQQENHAALLTAIAEQQTLANKAQRDLAADNVNFNSNADNNFATQPTAWGGSAATIAGFSQ